MSTEATQTVEAGLSNIEDTKVAQTTEQEHVDTEQVEATEETSAEEHEEAEEGEKTKKSGFEKRVKKLNKKAEDARREAEYWKSEALKNNQTQQTQQVQQVQQEQVAKPSLAQFNNDYEAYSEALADYKMQNYIAAQEEQKRQKEAEKLVKTYTKREQDFAAENPDYYDALEDVSKVPVHNDIRQVIWESDFGPQIAYHLAQNQEEIAKLNAMSPTKRLVELGKLEAMLTPAKKVEAKKQAKPAPAPVKPVSGAAPVISKSVYEMNKEELRAHLQAANKAELAKKRDIKTKN